MKKSLLALAALAATGAFAQSSVTILGTVDAGYRNISADAATSKRSDINFNNTATTALHFRGTEDLGGGLKALFQAELDWNPTQSSTLNGATSAGGQYFTGTPFNGEQFVGLSSNFGSLKLGAPNTAALDLNAVAQPFGTALGGGYSGTFGRLGTSGKYGVNQYIGGPSSGNRLIRHEKTARYDTPNFSGFAASLEYSFGNDKSATNSSNNNKYQAIGLTYANGPIKAGFNSTKISAGAVAAAGSSLPGVVTASNLLAGESVTHNFLAASYDLGVAKVSTGFSTSKNSVNTKENASSWNLAGSMPVGAFEFKANYLRVNDKTAANADARLYGLGADYFLSKRTALYARYENLDTNTNVSGVGAVKTFALGVRHGF